MSKPVLYKIRPVIINGEPDREGNFSGVVTLPKEWLIKSKIRPGEDSVEIYKTENEYEILLKKQLGF